MAKDWNQDRSQRRTDSCKQRGTGGKLIACVGIGAERRNHTPVGNIVHGIGDAEQKIKDAEQADEAPTVQVCIEKQINDDGGG